MQIGTFELDDGAVDQMQRRFYRNRNHQSKVHNFESLLSDFFDENKSSQTIADKYGLSREGVSYNFRQYIAALLPDEFEIGLNLRKFYKLARMRIRSRKLPKSNLLLEIAEIVKKLGYDFEQVPNSNPIRRFNTWEILINGHLCQVRQSSVPCIPAPRSSRQYSRIQVTPATIRKGEYLIVRQKAERIKRFFIFPLAEISQWLGNVSNKWLYLSVEKLPLYHNNKPVLDYWQYENAWHFLESNRAKTNPRLSP